MTFTIYAGGRRSGKTTMAVLWYRANPGAKLIVRDTAAKDRMGRMFGIPDRDMVTFEQVWNGQLKGYRGPVGIEDLDLMIKRAMERFWRGLPGHVEMATFDTDAVDRWAHVQRLDPSAMEHVAAELEETINYESQMKHGEQTFNAEAILAYLDSKVPPRLPEGTD